MIILLKKRQEFLDFRSRWHSPSVGLVPTMGNLHRGHLSLLETSLKENELSILTIFVNPKQFGPKEDFAKYPRTLQQDCLLVEELKQRHPHKTLVIFAPEDESEIYPSGFSTSIKVTGHLTQILCGKSRPTHFEGVTTVVALLFQMARPTHAYFGKKDYQQFNIIKKMAADLLMPLHVIGLPIIRDDDGLALSSRNQYLSHQQRAIALQLPLSLKKIASTYTLGQTPTPEPIPGCSWDYCECRDAETLADVTEHTRLLVVLGALVVGHTRLIDNLEFSIHEL